jgi:type IV pilus biogenesis/stability protein PilW
MRRILLVGAACVLLAGLIAACTTQNVAEQKSQAEAIRNLGEAYLRQGNYRAALKQLKKAEEIYPSDHILQDDLGLAYFYLKEPDQAISHFKKALEIKSDYAPARNNLGNAYAQKKEWKKAIEQYKAVTLDLLYGTPQFPLSNLGVVYYEIQEYELSAHYFHKALDIKPDFVQALYGLAKTYVAMGRVPDAITRLEKAVSISSDSAGLYFELANTYALNQDYSKALSAYHKVVEIDPNSTLADRALIEAGKIKNRQ